MKLWILVICLLVWLFSPVTGIAATRDEILAQREAAEKRFNEAMTLMGEKNYPEAITKFIEANRSYPGNQMILYNLACALSRDGQKDKALEALALAVRSGYSDHQHMAKDTDLDAVREDERFKKLMKAAETRAKGLPTMFHVPTGYQEDGDKNYAMLVLLHGSGGAPQPLFESCRKLLGEDLLFILAPCGSHPVGPGYTWSQADIKKITDLIKKKKEGHRIDRVYLLGFSAGGHLGYTIVLSNREVFDGFIPMAGALRRNVGDDILAKAKGLPIYSIQGEADPIVPLAAARQALERVKQHGAVTHLHPHPGGHQAPRNFGAVLKAALQWLDEHQPGRLDTPQAAD